MDHPSRRAAHPGRRLRRPQRRAERARAARVLIALAGGLLLAAAPAAAAPEVGLSTRGGIFVVDNPFLEPLDPALVETTGEASTVGLSGQLDLDADAWLRWRPGAAHRVDVALGGGFEAWQGDASTWAWRADVSTRYGLRLGDVVELFVGATGAGAAIDAFAEDDLLWAEGRAGVAFDLGLHRLDIGLAAGRRTLPDRPFVNADGTPGTGRDDDLLRARVDHCAFWTMARWCSGVGYDAVSVSAGGEDYDTLALSSRLDLPLGPVDAGLIVGGWRRAFGGATTRVDLGGLVEARIERALADGLSVAARYRYLRSTSDTAVGEYGQHLAGVEFAFALSSTPPRAPSARPIEEDDGWTFRHRAPDAQAVALVGDFGDWTPEPMAGPDADGWWTLTRPLPRGRHTYMFVVDGQFVRPAAAPAYADDGFGGEVGVVYVVRDRPAAPGPSAN